MEPYTEKSTENFWMGPSSLILSDGSFMINFGWISGPISHYFPTFNYIMGEDNVSVMKDNVRSLKI